MGRGSAPRCAPRSSPAGYETTPSRRRRRYPNTRLREHLCRPAIPRRPPAHAPRSTIGVVHRGTAPAGRRSASASTSARACCRHTTKAPWRPRRDYPPVRSSHRPSPSKSGRLRSRTRTRSKVADGHRSLPRARPPPIGTRGSARARTGRTTTARHRPSSPRERSPRSALPDKGPTRSRSRGPSVGPARRSPCTHRGPPGPTRPVKWPGSLNRPGGPADGTR
jgi:hypothetical protein